MKILVTGAAGFIGSRLMFILSQKGDEVIGLDNLNDYYDVRLKFGRLAECGIVKEKNIFNFGEKIQSNLFPNCSFVRLSLENKEDIDTLFKNEKFDKVLNLAAQAGVRHSINNPYVYINSNIFGFLNILEGCRHFKVKHLIFASSSSVYGLNTKVPYNEDDKVDSPVSLYAATKKSNELMAHSYSKLYGMPITGLRYFTVYGPWGRPDMSPMLFADAIYKNIPINVFNNGDMIRDFTYIDDIVEGTIRAVYNIPNTDDSVNDVAYKIFNIGGSQPIKLMDFIIELENAIGIKAKKIFLPMQPGDVYQTFADTTKLQKEIGYKPKVILKDGIKEFITWYNSEKNPLK